MFEAIRTDVMRAVRLTLVFAVMTGAVYTLGMTGLGQLLFHSQTNGSLITKGGTVVGSQLIGQQFSSSRYFWGRPSATTNASTGKPQPYAADNSGGSNLAPSNPALINRVKASVKALQAANPAEKGKKVPVDLVTTDFSGLDPNISEAGALYQVQRVAAARGLSASRVRALVEANVQGRILWIFGEPHVDVLQLNLALDGGAAG